MVRLPEKVCCEVVHGNDGIFGFGYPNTSLLIGMQVGLLAVTQDISLRHLAFSTYEPVTLRHARILSYS